MLLLNSMLTLNIPHLKLIIPKNIRRYLWYKYEFHYKIIILLLRKLSHPWKKNIYVIGDSHAYVFDYINNHQLFSKNYQMLNLVVQGATAYGLKNLHSKTQARKHFLNFINWVASRQSWLIIMVGEVDCEVLLWLKTRNKPLLKDKFIKKSIQSYYEFIQNIYNKGYKKIILITPIIPTLNDCEIKQSIVKERKAINITYLNRTQNALLYGKEVCKLAKLMRIKCINVQKKIINQKTKLLQDKYKNKYLDHHLNHIQYGKLLCKNLQKIFEK